MRASTQIHATPRPHRIPHNQQTHRQLLQILQGQRRERPLIVRLGEANANLPHVDALEVEINAPPALAQQGLDGLAPVLLR